MLQMGESKTRLTCEDCRIQYLRLYPCITSNSLLEKRVCVFECLPGLFLVALVEDIGAFVDVVDFEVEGKVLVNFVKVSL